MKHITVILAALLTIGLAACTNKESQSQNGEPSTNETHMKKNIGQKMALYPTPATVIGTVGEDGKVNWMLCAHIGIATHSKLMLSIHSSHFTAKNIDRSRRLSVNLISEDFLSAADYTGTVSGERVDKSSVLPYHLGEAGLPVIDSAPLAMECEVVETHVIDGFNNYVCNVLNTYIDEDKLTDDGKIDYSRLKPVLFEMPTYKYLRTGDIIGDCRQMGLEYGNTLNNK